MSKIDWRQLSGPARLAPHADAARRRHRRRRIRQPAGGPVRGGGARQRGTRRGAPGAEDRWLAAGRVPHQPDRHPRSAAALARRGGGFDPAEHLLQPGAVRSGAGTHPRSGRDLGGLRGRDGVHLHLAAGPDLPQRRPADLGRRAYTYERTINPDFASPHANKLALVDSFETPDDQTVAHHAERAVRALPRRRLHPRPGPRPDPGAAASGGGDG